MEAPSSIDTGVGGGRSGDNPCQTEGRVAGLRARGLRQGAEEGAPRAMIDQPQRDSTLRMVRRCSKYDEPPGQGKTHLEMCAYLAPDSLRIMSWLIKGDSGALPVGHQMALFATNGSGSCLHSPTL
ncbi:hypothetical protein NDU88_009626 [Pleurodeles waltl]|uniref:Uncharacterized protein n=1 Tax=Pleurodeles waltl TaxID=8319 RepID=A0AAV7RX43_PLEWA|nr:hypothetical protein NDU88_009626 [Pleurodeles waltl]